MKKILILGASGFVGRKLYEKLMKHPLFYVTGTYYTKAVHEFAYVNLLNDSSVKWIIAKTNPDIIIWAVKDMPCERDLITIGLKNVLKYSSVKCKMVYLSTNVFNGGKGSYKEYDQPDYLCQGHHADDYVIAKLLGEKMIKQRANYVILRPGVIFGKDFQGNWDSRISKMINNVFDHKYIKVSKRRIATWVDIDDLICTIIRIIENNFIGIIHVGTVEKTTGYDMNMYLARKLNLDTKYILPLETDEIKQNDDSYDLSLFRATFM